MATQKEQDDFFEDEETEETEVFSNSSESVQNTEEVLNNSSSTTNSAVTNSNSSVPSTFTITGMVVDKIEGHVVYIQADSASDGLPTGVSYCLTFARPSKGLSAYDYGVIEPEVGQNITVYGEWEQGRNYGTMDVNYRSIIPMDITINS